MNIFFLTKFHGKILPSIILLFYSGKPTTLCEVMGKAEMWLIRTYWDFEFPHPYLPNFEFVGGLQCKPAKQLPQVTNCAYFCLFEYLLLRMISGLLFIVFDPQIENWTQELIGIIHLEYDTGINISNITMVSVNDVHQICQIFDTS